jgi:hypothetical protein
MIVPTVPEEAQSKVAGIVNTGALDDHAKIQDSRDPASIEQNVGGIGISMNQLVHYFGIEAVQPVC